MKLILQNNVFQGYTLLLNQIIPPKFLELVVTVTTTSDFWNTGPIVWAAPALYKNLQELGMTEKIPSFISHTYIEYVSEAHQSRNSCIEQMILCEVLCYLVLKEKVCH